MRVRRGAPRPTPARGGEQQHQRVADGERDRRDITSPPPPRPGTWAAATGGKSISRADLRFATCVIDSVGGADGAIARRAL